MLSSLKRSDRIVLRSAVNSKIVYKPKQLDYETKPRGLWYAFGAKWLKLITSDAWGYREEYQNLDYYKSVYKLNINPSKMLILSNQEQIRDFTKKYAFQNDEATFKKEWLKLRRDDPEGWGETRFQSYLDFKNDELLGRQMIRWPLVAKHYSGIEINPWYQYPQYDFNWLQAWEIASGCVWDKTAITKMTKIKLPKI